LKRLAWIGIIVLALVILVLGIAGVARGIFGNRYEAQIRMLEAKGEPVTPEELMGKPIPAAENAALVYEQARSELDDPSVEKQTKLLAAFSSTGADAAQWRAADRALADVSKALALIDRAAAMPRCRFELDWSDPIKATMPTFPAMMRMLCRYKYTDAQSSARRGDFGEATGDIVTIFGMAKSMEDCPLTILQLTRMALVSMAIKAIETSLEYGPTTESQARTLFDAAARIDIAHGFKRGLQGERIFLMEMYGPDSFPNLAASGGSGSVLQPAERGLASLYAHSFLSGDMAIYLEILSSQVEGANLGYRDAKSQGLFDEPELPFYAVMSKMGADTMPQRFRYTYEEKLNRTQVFLALQAYKARYGGYPASIKELKSKLGWRLPKDPFSGKDFIYKRQAKGFILYSVGPDMKDDGGRAIPNHDVELGSKGDIVLQWDK
jgi:hypothetical protein